MVAIGIDLGTTNSCVAAWKNGRVEIIANELGNRITPSCVAFNATERFIGTPAVMQAIRNPENTVYDVKRLMGRRFDDPVLQKDKADWPFTVVDVGGSPRVQVRYKNEVKTLSPEEISAMVLVKLKETAEKYLDCEVKDAVITVPAYFNDAQRQATLDAGEIAGLNVLRIINEPTAAALAYGLTTGGEGKRTILIYDLGGGTFDVSIVTLERGPKINVLATTGDAHLGGSDVDKILREYLEARFNTKYGKKISDNRRAKSKMKTAAEECKVALSTNFKAEVYIEALIDGIECDDHISRAQFEELCSTLIHSTLGYVEKALVDAKLTKNAIDEVVLVGGSTRIPMVKQFLQDFFVGTSLKESINPDEAVAYGAAVQAAILSRVANIEFKDLSFYDVTALSLGTEVKGGKMDVVIPRNTRIPCNVSSRYYTTRDDQTSMTVRVYQGEGELVKDNTLLGSFLLEGIPPAPAGEGSTLDTFTLNENGVLTVTSVERVTGSKNSITLTVNKGLSKKDKEDMRKGVERMRRNDARERKEEEEEYCIERLTLKS